MKRMVMCAMIMMVLPSAALAQSTKCNDLTPASVNTKNPPAAYEICWNGKDDSGVAYTAAEVTALKVFVNGSLVKTVPNPLSIAESPNAAGLRLFSTPGTGAVALTKGDKTVTYVFTTVDGDTEASAPYSFRIIGAPSRPVGGRIVANQ